MRAIWRGHIRFSLVTIPIRIYNAIDTAETIRFNQLHKDCNGNECRQTFLRKKAHGHLPPLNDGFDQGFLLTFTLV